MGSLWGLYNMRMSRDLDKLQREMDDALDHALAMDDLRELRKSSMVDDTQREASVAVHSSQKRKNGMNLPREVAKPHTDLPAGLTNQ